MKTWPSRVHWISLRPHFIAKSFRTLTKKPGTAKAIPDYFGSGKRTWSRLPAGVLLPSGESPAPTEAGAETGAAERHWRSLTPRHALRRAQPCLVAESLCALTKNREASIVLASLFLAGAEGLEPSARGFGVDVRGRGRGQGKTSVARFSRRSPQRAVLIWCCEEFFTGHWGLIGRWFYPSPRFSSSR